MPSLDAIESPMARVSYEFKQHVPLAGFRVDKRMRMIVEDWSKGETLRSAPQDIHREIIKIETTEDLIGFMKKFGSLTMFNVDMGPSETFREYLDLTVRPLAALIKDVDALRTRSKKYPGSHRKSVLSAVEKIEGQPKYRRPELRFMYLNGHLSFTPIFSELLNYAYFLVAAEIGGILNSRVCEWCKDSFPAKRNASTCSTRCRTALWRDRQT